MTFTIAANVQQQPEFHQDWQHFLSIIDDKSELSDIQLSDIELSDIQLSNIQQYVNGKQLACPMPLLKLKMALKNTAIGKQVYVTATDPNSEKDIGAFCRHVGHELTVVRQLPHSEQSSNQQADQQQDTIFHLLITKNC